MKNEKLLDMINIFLIYGKSYYDKKRGAFILEKTPKEDTYIFSCTCDDVGFYVVYMENGENKTQTFLNNTKKYVTLKRMFDEIKKEMTKEQEQETKESYIDYTDKEVDECLKDIKDVQAELRQQHIEKHISKCRGKTQQGEEMREETQQNINTADDYYKFKRDKGKPKLLQVPVEAIQAISEIMDYGSNKYGAGFWDKVEPERYMQAAARHLYACQNDINSKDKESGQKHIKHALCNIAYVVALIEREESKNK